MPPMLGVCKQACHNQSADCLILYFKKGGMCMVKDLVIVSGPSFNELWESLEKYFKGEKKEVFFRIVYIGPEDKAHLFGTSSEDKELIKNPEKYRAEKYIGQITGLAASGGEEEGKPAFVDIKGIVRREYDKYSHDLQINDYNTRRPYDGSARIIKMKRRKRTNPKKNGKEYIDPRKKGKEFINPKKKVMEKEYFNPRKKKKGKARPRTKRETGQ